MTPRAAAFGIALTIAALAATSTRAGGQTPMPPFPQSIPLRVSSGAVVCRAAPMPDGVLYAAHCHRAGALTLDGALTRWSIDPARDLAHMPIGAVPKMVMRRAIEGEALYWRNDRAAGSVTVLAHGWQAPDGPNHYDYYRDDTHGGEAVVLTSWRSGSRFMSGDSGTGAHGEDGALIGVLVSACTDLNCSPVQSSAFVAVP